MATNATSDSVGTGLTTTIAEPVLLLAGVGSVVLEVAVAVVVIVCEGPLARTCTDVTMVNAALAPLGAVNK